MGPKPGSVWSLETAVLPWKNPNMSLIADRRGRLTGPEWFEPGAEYKASRDEQGRIILEKMATMPVHRVAVTLEKHGNFTCLKTDLPVPDEAIAEAVRAHREEQSR